jgi:hypothetical protein
MQRVLAALVAALLIGAFLCLLGIPVFAARRQRRRDRFRTLSQGETAEALITQVAPRGGSGACRVSFSFQAQVAGPAVEGTQKSTLAALESLGLSAGSRVRVHYLPRGRGTPSSMRWQSPNASQRSGKLPPVTRSTRHRPCVSSLIPLPLE